MSKPKDPKDVAIGYVMTAPIEVAAAFVSTLASVVKARQLQAEKKPAAAKPATTPAARKSTREVSVSAPASADAQQPAAGGLPISSATPASH